MDLTQKYILNYINILLNKFSYNLDNLVNKQGNIYSCEYASFFKEEQSKNESNLTYEFLLNKSPNLIY